MRTPDRSTENAAGLAVCLLACLLAACAPGAGQQSEAAEESTAGSLEMPATPGDASEADDASGASNLKDWEVYPQDGEVLTAVNARASLEEGAEVAALLKEGETVRILGTDGVHYEVETPGGTGYVARKYLIPERYLAENHPVPAAGSKGASEGSAAGGAGHAVDPDRPMVALTFDDGPRAEVTDRILDVLEEYGGRATFYMMGGRIVGRNNECLRKMAAMGCGLGNHTYYHDYFNVIPASDIRQAVRKADYMIEETCGQAPTSIRPPGGAVDESASRELKELGLPVVLWSIDTLDWETQDPERTVAAVLDNLRDGDIVLMHDVYPESADAAEILIPKLTEMGYQLVTVSELAEARGVELEPGRIYRQFWR